MEIIYSIIFSIWGGIGGGLMIFAVVLAIFAWQISKILKPGRIKIFRSKTDETMEKEGFENKTSFIFREIDRRKIKELALESLACIFRSSAKEILDTYSVAITINKWKSVIPKRSIVRATIWTKKKPEKEEEKDSIISTSILSRDY